MGLLYCVCEAEWRDDVCKMLYRINRGVLNDEGFLWAMFLGDTTLRERDEAVGSKALPRVCLSRTTTNVCSNICLLSLYPLFIVTSLVGVSFQTDT